MLTLLYGLESWTMKAENKTRITAPEIKFQDRRENTLVKNQRRDKDILN
jgi:hypothetical protein